MFCREEREKKKLNRPQPWEEEERNQLTPENSSSREVMEAQGGSGTEDVSSTLMTVKEEKSALKKRLAELEVKEEDRNQLFINYLPQAMRDKELFALFSTVDPVVLARIARHKFSGYSYGYGFVDYRQPEDAAKAISSLNRMQVENKTLKVSYSLLNLASVTSSSAD